MRLTVRVARGTAIDLALITGFSLPLLFLSLGALPIALWDESRLANNAIEMRRDGFSLVTTYLSHPDLWNTKPPLLIWLQTASFGIFGPSEWALRLPSALASLTTSGMVYWFCLRVTSSRATAIAGALVLLTTYGFMAPHVARSGDYDALLVFFTTAIFTCCYFILQGIRLGVRPPNSLLACGSLALTGAIMTKGIAGLLILPGIAFASLAGGAAPRALGDRRILLAAFLPFVAAGSFYLAREAASAGYFEAVWANELGGRFMKPLEGHAAPATFYILGLLSPWSSETRGLNLASAAPWSWAGLILLQLGMCTERCKPALIYLAVVLVAFLIVISSAQTRIYWYVAPAYPLIACIAAISAFGALQHVLSKRQIPERRPFLLLLGIFALIAAIAGLRIVESQREAIRNVAANPDLRPAAFLREIMPTLRPGDQLRIVQRRKDVSSIVSPVRMMYAPQESFYASLMRAHGVNAEVVNADYRARQGDLLMWCEPTQPDLQHTSSAILASHGPCHLAKSKGSHAQVADR